MISALGSAGSLFDALRSLTSSKSSSANPGGAAPNPVDSGDSTETQSAGMSGQGKRPSSISPQTMNALIHVQAQSGSTRDDRTGSNTDSSDTHSGAANSSDPRIRHLSLTVVQLPLTDLVPVDVSTNPAFFSFSPETKV